MLNTKYTPWSEVSRFFPIIDQPDMILSLKVTPESANNRVHEANALSSYN